MCAVRAAGGRPAVTGPSAQAVTFKRFTEAAVSDGRPDVPADLDGIVARALESDSDARYATMADFASALGGLDYRLTLSS